MSLHISFCYAFTAFACLCLHCTNIFTSVRDATVHCLVCLYGCTSVCATALWSSWPRKALKQRAETLCAVTGGGIQVPALSFTEQGSSLTLSITPSPPTPPRTEEWRCRMPLLQDEDRHQSKVPPTPPKHFFFWINWHLASTASKMLAVPPQQIKLDHSCFSSYSDSSLNNIICSTAISVRCNLTLITPGLNSISI